MVVRRLVVVAVWGALVGCAPSVLTLNRPALRATAPRTIAAPRLQAAWKTLYLPLSCGDLSIRVGDPAATIRTRLVRALVDRFGLEVVGDGAADLMLEVETTDCAFGRGKIGLLGPDQVTFIYGATLRLKDTRTNRVLAQGSCDSRTVTGPTFEEARDPNARRGEVEDTIEYCTDDFRHRLLELY